MSLLLDMSYFGGSGWTVFDERAWRTRGYSQEAHRANRRSSVSATRSFENRDEERAAIIQIIPYASMTDAIEAMPRMHSVLIPNPKAKAEVVYEEKILELPFKTSGISMGYERHFKSQKGDGVSRFIYGSKGHIVFGVLCSRRAEPWLWEEIESLIDAEENED
jgi:hypothetical protein